MVKIGSVGLMQLNTSHKNGRKILMFIHLYPYKRKGESIADN